MRRALLHRAGMYGYAGGEGRPFVAASGHHGLIQGEVLLLDEHYSVGADREEGLEDQRKVGSVLQGCAGRQGGGPLGSLQGDPCSHVSGVRTCAADPPTSSS